MSFLPLVHSEIWTQNSGIWPDFAKSEILPESAIWLFPFLFRGLGGCFQISEGPFGNLVRNLDFTNKINGLRQIPDFGTLPPKGVGDLPALRGRVTTYPWAHSPDTTLGLNPVRRQQPDLPKRSAVVAFNPLRQAEKETPMAPMSLIPTTMIAPPPAMPVVLALDLGTTTGWALQTADGLITSGTVSFRPSRYDGGGMRYLRFRNWLDQLGRDAGPITAIHFEEVRRHAGTDAAHVYGGLLATLTAWAETAGIAYQGVPVGTIKRHATGKGNADKAAMMAAARARGFSPTDDNEADAIAILLWALETRGGVQ